MAGELVPLVMIPRYTMYSSTAEFTTIAMDVTPYQNAILNVWRTAIGDTDSGATPTFKIYFQESTDQVNWSACGGTNSSGENPSSLTETQYTAALGKRWFRVKVQMTGTYPMATCWCVGFLEARER